jgi:hypothetical protein
MHDTWKRVKMDVSRSKDPPGQKATAEREPSPRWSATIEAAPEATHAAVPRPVIRINAARLIVAVSVVALMTMLLADPTRGPNGTVPVGEGATVELTGLPSGGKISSGRPFGADGWRLPVADLADAVFWPPQDFVGAIDVAVELRLADDTLADRQAVRWEWAQRDSPMKEIFESSDRLLANDAAQVAELCRRGEELLSAGDIAAARLLLERAARAGSPRAAFMLGTSYDPKVLKYLGVRGVPADIALARNWYEKAKEHGYTKVPRLIGSVTSDEGKPVAPINNPGGRPAAE